MPSADTPDKKGKPMREVSVERCEFLGKGVNGAVFRLDEETVVSKRISQKAVRVQNPSPLYIIVQEGVCSASS